MDSKDGSAEGFSSNTSRPAEATRKHRAPIRHHRRLPKHDEGARRLRCRREGRTEGAVKPCRRRKSEANKRGRKASKNRFPFPNRFPKLRKKREPVLFHKYNNLACGKQTGSHFPPLYARAGTGFFPQARKRAENTKRKPPPNPNSKAQSEDRWPARQRFGTARLWEDLTIWQQAETVRLID